MELIRKARESYPMEVTYGDIVLPEAEILLISGNRVMIKGKLLEEYLNAASVI